MSLSSTEYACVVVGDEPAGLWLLRRIAKLEPGWLDRGEILWLRMSSQVPKPVAVPLSMAQPFDLELGPSWSPELRLPGRSISWEADALRRAFPELPARIDLPKVGPRLRFPSPYVAAVRQALLRRPELLGYASGLWKAIGRAHRLQPETAVLMALQGGEMAWWDASKEIPTGVRETELAPRETPVEAFGSRGGMLSVTFRGHGPIVAKKWVFNLPWHQLHVLGNAFAPFRHATADRHELRSTTALVPLRLRVPSYTVPWTVRPLTIVFDTDEIPDIDTETWPLTLRDVDSEAQKEIDAWATVPRELPLEASLERLADAYTRVTRLFPFVDDKVASMDVPLSMETCFTDAQRLETMDRLESLLVERYDNTSFHTQTRKSGMFALMPSLHCHLPYPIGPLHEARNVVQQIVGKKRLQEEQQALRPTA